jgi:hypothetical protein
MFEPLILMLFVVPSFGNTVSTSKLIQPFLTIYGVNPRFTQTVPQHY